MNHADPRYLEAKRTVDQRARSTRVRETFCDALPDSPRILEIGCGTGSMVTNLVSWGIEGFTYVGIDLAPNVTAFGGWLRPKELRWAGYKAQQTPDGGRLGATSFAFRPGEAVSWLETVESADAVIAQSVLDLLDIPTVLSAIEHALSTGGVLYAPLTFDEVTVFLPEHPADDHVLTAYHRQLAASDGSPRAGRKLLAALEEKPGRTLAVDSADWIVRPKQSTYPADEAWFLDRILSMVGNALEDADEPEYKVCEEWLATRRAQLRQARLQYIAHQYDVLHQWPG